MTNDRNIVGNGVLVGHNAQLKPFSKIKTIKESPYSIIYSIPYSAEYYFTQKQRKYDAFFTLEKEYYNQYNILLKKEQEELSKKIQEIELQGKVEDLQMHNKLSMYKYQALDEIAKLIGVEVIKEEQLRMGNIIWNVGRKHNFPMRYKPNVMWTEDGIDVETYIRGLNDTEPVRLPFIAYNQGNFIFIHQPMDVLFPMDYLPKARNVREKMVRDKDNIVFFYYFYFPMEWEDYVSEYFYEHFRENDIRYAYTHYASFRREDSIRYGPRLIEKLVEWAQREGMSEIWFHPLYGRDGKAYEIEIFGKMGINYKIKPEFAPSLTPAEFENLINRFLLAGDEQSIKGLSVATLLTHPDTFTLVIGEENIETRWAVIPLGKNPEKYASIERTPPLVVVRVYASEEKINVLEDINPPRETMRIWKQLLPDVDKPIPPVGLYIVSGRTDSGKSTLLGLLAKHLAENGMDVAMLEDPIERMISGVNQTNVYVPPDLKKVRYKEAEEKVEQFIQSWLDTQLRANPDVIVVGEIRNELMMKKLLQLVKIGKLVLATIHAGSLVRTLTRLHKLGMSVEEIASDLLGISFLSLINRVNERYLVPVSPDVALEKLAMRYKYAPQELQLILRDVAGFFPGLVDSKAIEEFAEKRVGSIQNYVDMPEVYYVWNDELIKGKNLVDISLPERIQVGSHILITASIRERFNEILQQYGLGRQDLLKNLFITAPYFFSMGQHYKLLASEGLFPLETAISNMLAYDEVYPAVAPKAINYDFNKLVQSQSLRTMEQNR